MHFCILKSFSQECRNRGGWEAGQGAGAPDNCQTVVYFLYNSVLSEKEYNGQPRNMNFVPTALFLEKISPLHSAYIDGKV